MHVRDAGVELARVSTRKTTPIPVFQHLSHPGTRWDFPGVVTLTGQREGRACNFLWALAARVNKHCRDKGSNRGDMKQGMGRLAKTRRGESEVGEDGAMTIRSVLEKAHP